MDEDWIRDHQLEPHDIKTVFENLKADYRNLKLIPCPGSLTIAVYNVLDERTYKVSVEEVRSRAKQWKTDLDIQHLRHTYRWHGWSNAFLKEEAKKAADGFSDLMEARGRGHWKPNPMIGNWHM